MKRNVWLLTLMWLWLGLACEDVSVAGTEGKDLLGSCSDIDHCNDNTKNCGEDGVDCGGPCDLCTDLCGDGTCTAPENCNNCPFDCTDCGACGDGECQPQETPANCPDDCS